MQLIIGLIGFVVLFSMWVIAPSIMGKRQND